MFKKEVLLKTFPKKSNFDCNGGNGQRGLSHDFSEICKSVTRISVI